MLNLPLLPAFSWAQSKLSRQEFARASTNIAMGTNAQEVKQLLGSADRIVKITEDNRLEQRPEIIYSDAREVWDYGIQGQHGFPTVGQVHFDGHRNVIKIYGASETTIQADRLPEGELRNYLCMIESIPPLYKWPSSTMDVIEIVNSIQPLGKEMGM
jgi:hypothetical protein